MRMPADVLARATLLVEAVRAVSRAGVLGPATPGHLLPAVRAHRAYGPSLAALAAIAAERSPHTPAIIDELGELSYRELDRRSAAIAAALQAEYRVGPGRTVGVMCRNHRGFAEATVAASRLGADLVLLNTEFSGPQLAQVFARNAPDLVVLDEEFLPAVTVSARGVPLVVAWADGPTELDTLDTLDALAGTSRPAARSPRRPGRTTLLTSGTTGSPKGAPRTPSSMALVGPTATILTRTRLRAGDAVLIAPPLFHGFGLITFALAVLLRSPTVLRRRFDAEATLAAIDAHRVGCAVAVPAMLQRILRLPPAVRARYDLSSLHTLLSGAAPLGPTLATSLLDQFGDVLYNGYGSSEIGIGAIATPDDLRADPGTVGRPTLGTPIRVLDESGSPVPHGVTGNVFVGGSLVFSGYAEGGNKSVVDGLMSTGDRGHFDTAGRLYIDGRADDMILSGGENVYPQEVENALARHPGVADAAVIGAADPEFGQRLVAYVVPAPDSGPSAEELGHYVRSNLARYKVPREFVFLDELPRSPTGKLLRRQLPTRPADSPGRCSRQDPLDRVE
jgi:acyl-CoA synthetase (AMP-forming)/AMP-acid ligase II